ncbi:MAG: hypothetical protein AAF658_16670 [Myxococcota bacterium]
MRGRVIQSLVTFGFGLACAACGSDNELSGSISESFSLDFDRTQVRLLVDTDELSIEYLRDLGNTTAKPVKVVVDTTDLPLGADTRVSGDVFMQRVLIQREAQTGGDFPEITGGTVVFDSINLQLREMMDDDGNTFFVEPEGDIEVKGEFDAVFTNGRTLFGKFRSDLQVDDPDAPVGTDG